MKRHASRRDILTAGALGALSLFHITRGARAAEAKVEAREVISHQRNLYHGWPTLTRRADGELLVVCSGGRESHVCPFGRVELMRSSDDGQTWSWPRILIDGAIDDRDAGILETDKKSLLVTTFTSLAYEDVLRTAATKKSVWPPARLKSWLAVNRRTTAAQRKQELGVWMIRSTDDGLHWSPPYRCLVNSPHGPIQLSDGRQLYAGKALWTEKSRVGVCHSRDDGASWQWLAEIPTREGDDHDQYHELHAIETKSGRLIAQIRNHNSRDSRETLQSESDDGGKTWSVPHDIGVWGLPSHLLKLADGRLLMSYGYRRPPFGNQARISDDDGTTWSSPMTISGDGASGDLGYPSTVQLKDGSLVTVWYEKLRGSPKAVLRQARWSIS